MADFTPSGAPQAGSVKDYSSGLSVPVREQADMPSWVTNMPANLLDQTIKLTDQQIQDTQHEAIRAEKEKIDKDVRQAEFSYTVQKGEIEAGVLPQGIQDKQEALGRLNNAYKNGALSESNYYSRLDAVSRELRSRYPGYKDEIDGYMSKLTGTNPANAVVKDIMSRMSHTKTDAGQADRIHTERELIKHGFMPPPNMALDDMKSLNAQFNKKEIDQKKLKQDIDTEKSVIGLNKDRREETLDRIDREATSSSIVVTNAAIAPLINTTVNQDGSVNKSVVDQLIEAKANGTVTPEMQRQANVAAASITAAYNREKSKFIASLGGNATSEQIAKASARFDEQSKTIASHLTTGDWSALASVKQENEATLQFGINYTYAKDETIKNVAIIEKASPTIGKMLEGILTKTPTELGGLTSVKSKLETSVGAAILSKIPTVKDPENAATLDKIAITAEAKGINPGKAVTSAVTKMQEIVKDKKVPEKERSDYARALVGNQMDTYTSRFTTTSDKQKAFMQYTDPATIEEIRKLEPKFPGLIEKHNANILRNGVVALEAQVRDAESFAGQRTMATKISYDATNGVFKEVNNPDYIKPASMPVGQTSPIIERAVRDLNLSLNRIGKGFMGPGQSNYEVKQLNELVAQTGFKFAPMVEAEKVVKENTGRLPPQ